MAFDVEGRVGFGVTEFLCLLEYVGKRQTLLAHFGQDEVGGAVDDAGDPFDVVGGQAFTQRLDDRDAAGHGRFKGHDHALGAGAGKDFVTVFGQQFLVGGDHVLAVVDGREYQLLGDAGAADQFHDDVDVGVGGNQPGVADHFHVVTDEFACLGHVQVGGHFECDRAAGAAADFFCVAFQHGGGTAADRTDAHDAHMNRLHRCSCVRCLNEYVKTWLRICHTICCGA